MEKLVGKVLFEYLEFGTTWVIQREHNSRILKDMELIGDQLLALFVGTLFDCLIRGVLLLGNPFRSF